MTTIYLLHFALLSFVLAAAVAGGWATSSRSEQWYFRVCARALAAAAAAAVIHCPLLATGNRGIITQSLLCF